MKKGRIKKRRQTGQAVMVAGAARVDDNRAGMPVFKGFANSLRI
jgi:hypothetical protein